MYHGCFPRNADGTNRIIEKGTKCISPTYECFQKDQCDVPHDVKARSHTKNEPKNNYQTFSRCLTVTGFIKRWIKAAKKKKQQGN